MSAGDLAGIVAAAVGFLVMLGGVVAWVNKVTNGAHLKQQDEQLGEIKGLALQACEDARAAKDTGDLAREELREHMRREELAFTAPWWRRHRMRL